MVEASAGNRGHYLLYAVCDLYALLADYHSETELDEHIDRLITTWAENQNEGK